MLSMYFSSLALLFLPVVLLQGIEDIISKFQQSDYKLNFEWFEVVSYNKHDVKYFHGITFKYNRTSAVFNLTYEYNLNVGTELELVVQGYKFASNEYRVFPMRFQVNFCYGLSKNMIGFDGFYKCGNFSGCPLLKGRRDHICNFSPDQSHFPPFVPNGRYRIDILGLYKNKEMFVLRGYGEISHPIVKK